MRKDYAPGDKVWALSGGHERPAGWYPGIVLYPWTADNINTIRPQPAPCYALQLQDIDGEFRPFALSHIYMRPRRDDEGNEPLADWTWTPVQEETPA